MTTNVWLTQVKPLIVNHYELLERFLWPTLQMARHLTDVSLRPRKR